MSYISGRILVRPSGNRLLAAHALGVGACWAGYFEMAAVNYALLQKALGIPEENRPYGAMMLGYPKYNYSRIPLRKEPDVRWL